MWIFILIFSIFASAETPAISLNKLTLEQKVGQMFMFGFKGTKMTPELAGHLRATKPGALILFGRNIKTLTQTSNLNYDLQQMSLDTGGLPLFLAIDQEGGSVLRIRTSPSLPSAYTIGNTNDPTLAFQAGKVTGEVLSLLGFNMNLAPVLDITDSSLSSFISSRSFSDSPHKISTMGVAMAQGLAESKVLPIAKHFPGHGPIALDSHKMTPHRQLSYSSLLANDLVPFTQLANTDINAGVMVAHIAYPQVDSSGLPATYSKKIISGILLDQLKFKGLVLTDDLEMSGAATLKKIEDRAITSIRAGSDLILLGWSVALQKRAVKAVIAAVRSGKIPESRINASVSKILSYKSQYLASATRAPASATSLKVGMKNIQYGSVYSDIIAKFFERLPGLSGTAQPFRTYTVVSPVKSFSTSFKRYISDPSVTITTSIKNKFAPGANSLIVFHAASPKALAELYAMPDNLRKRTVVVSSHPRVHVANKTSYLDVIEVFSSHPNLGGFMADAINRSSQKVTLAH